MKKITIAEARATARQVAEDQETVRARYRETEAKRNLSVECSEWLGGWLEITENSLPPKDVPVWLYIPEVRQPLIGCRTYDDGWCWARCYDDFWYDGGWRTSTADMDDYKPSHWMPLPEPP